MKASIPSRHQPPQAAQKPLIWFAFSLVLVIGRGTAVAGVAAMRSFAVEVEKPGDLTWENPKSQIPKTKSQQSNPKFVRLGSLGIWDFGNWDLPSPCMLRWRN